MREIFLKIEEEKKKKNFDQFLRKILEMAAARNGGSDDQRAAIRVIKERINKEIVLPGLGDA
jgi:hypothetical protein